MVFQETLLLNYYQTKTLSQEANDTMIWPNVIGQYKYNYIPHSDDLGNSDSLTIEEDKIKWHTE